MNEIFEVTLCLFSELAVLLEWFRGSKAGPRPRYSTQVVWRQSGLECFHLKSYTFNSSFNWVLLKLFTIDQGSKHFDSSNVSSHKSILLDLQRPNAAKQLNHTLAISRKVTYMDHLLEACQLLKVRAKLLSPTNDSNPANNPNFFIPDVISAIPPFPASAFKKPTILGLISF